MFTPWFQSSLIVIYALDNVAERDVQLQQQQRQSRQQQQARISSAAIQHKIALILSNIQVEFTLNNLQRYFPLPVIASRLPVVACLPLCSRLLLCLVSLPLAWVVLQTLPLPSLCLKAEGLTEVGTIEGERKRFYTHAVVLQPRLCVPFFPTG